ncbi:MAG: methionine--tRNA ligase subunit beta [Planctomycetia bacterium]|nr:methionine--tRNA ligase subunit beta [Planctomycetia bacterium]MBL6915139.1 methionine--tRNA ligase subunit beta [Planctomycetota bacterium]MDG1455213.1 methionine--tRNA ligase subunit beta [Planctomycetota bacterium]MDG2083452.1 methionine--tRNA ligase subunit beta [Planctomycetota bacterium]HCW44296.1 methionine--tRNA ligase subunit beta [Planctomycetota bacterium]
MNESADAEVSSDDIPTINFDDFTKVELRTAKVLEVEPHPKADRLWLLTIDGGTEKRQIVAGVRAHYTRDELKGKTIVVVWNLEPATIRGVESRGMLLAVEDEGVVRLLGPDGMVAPGCRVG